jgi:aminoglycoside phosphotransferase (APT) family kinase protein
MNETLQDWCAAILGPYEIASGNQRPDARSGISRLRTRTGHCYLKVHRDREMWACEVHAYERWAPVFGPHAPPLFAVRDEPPLALLIGELEGQVLENVKLPIDRERAAWRTAGRMLARLHALPGSAFFGPSDRHGAPPEGATSDAVAYVSSRLARELEQATRDGLLDAAEQATLRAALERAGVFAGESPVPCHRDYNPYNWLVTPEGEWSGVIDFEFAYRDVRVAEFSRYPDWEWIERPDRVEALLEGYGRTLTEREKQQCFVTRAQYALSAITWGTAESYHGFVAEGRRALAHLAAHTT